MSKYDVASEQSLNELNTHLTSHIFIGGQTPNGQDALTYEAFVGNVPSAEKYPGIAGWYGLIHYFRPNVQEQWKAEDAKKAAPAEKKDKKPEHKKVEPKKEEIADEDDLFGDDDEEDPAEKAAREERMKKALEAKKAKDDKKAKEGKTEKQVIAKSLIILDVKVFEMDQDLAALAKKIFEIVMDGLVWKTEFKTPEIAFGMKKLVVGLVVEDEKVSVDDVIEIIQGWEEEVQSVDIASFDKI